MEKEEKCVFFLCQMLKHTFYNKKVTEKFGG